MAKTFLTVMIIVLLNVLVGCEGPDSGRGQIMPKGAPIGPVPAPIIKVADAGEVDIIEQVAANRQAYRQALVALVTYYTNSGNALKLAWAQKELHSLDTMPKYRYVVEANVMGPELKAAAAIPEADKLYNEGLALQKEAERMVVVKNDDMLRLALDKYTQVIRKHPTSDKIDDAAFKAGSIYQYFKDYSIALLYYQRTYQWNPQAPYPARFRAAYILDDQMHRRAEALELYKEALQTEGKYGRYREHIEWAEKRIAEMTGKTADQ